jgi:hypothetical protein
MRDPGTRGQHGRIPRRIFSIRPSSEPAPGYMPSASSRAMAKVKAPRNKFWPLKRHRSGRRGKCSRKLAFFGLLYQHSPCWHRRSAKQVCIISITLRGIIIDTATGIPTGVTGILIVVATMTNGGGGIAFKQEVTPEGLKHTAYARESAALARPLALAISLVRPQ